MAHKELTVSRIRKQHINDNTKQSTTKFTATNLAISTCTVITGINSKVNLGLLSRFVNIYEQYSNELEDKNGGIYNLEYYGNCARGETLIDSIKDEFNNQATLKFKYWGFRTPNIKVFANGKLQMTGLKYEEEAIEIAKLLINIIDNINIIVITDITQLTTISKKFDFQLVYDIKTKKIYYFRKYYNRFIKDYNFNIEIKKKELNTTDNIITDNITNVNFIRKGFVNGIHDIYNVQSDIFEDEHNAILTTNEWNGDKYIRDTIQFIENIKTLLSTDLDNTLYNSNTLFDIKFGIEKLMKKYSDFKITMLDKILYDIGKHLYSTDEQTILDIKYRIGKFSREYKHFLEKKINRLVNIRTIDITICNYVKKYLDLESNFNIHNIDIQNNNNFEISVKQLELQNNIIEEPHKYFISNTETVLINSDMCINHNINLKKISKILTKIGLYNSYEPDDYPGVLTKYYYNVNNKIQGICSCEKHCSTKEKKSICTKITISVFRPGSIIITGARNLIHLMSAHDLILKILKDNIDSIKCDDNTDDEEHKLTALMNNEIRKISKKPRLFFIKKQNIMY